MEDGEPVAIQSTPSRFVHVKKRSLRNKSLAIDFDEKDLKNYVTGFHKRKKKRRKEALKLQKVALRRKRIEARKKRKLEREFTIYGGPKPNAVSTAEGDDEINDEGEDDEQVPSISGTKTYDNGNLKVTVTTSEISPEEEETAPNRKRESESAAPVERKSTILAAKKKPMKRTAQRKGKAQKKRDKKKGKSIRGRK